jgi:cytochrome P450
MTTSLSLNPFTRDAVQDPYPVHAALRGEGLVFVPEVDAWMASRFIDVEAILRDQENFTARNSAGGGGRLNDPELAAAYKKGYPMARTLMTADPPEHRWYRGMLGRKFMPKTVAGMEDYVSGVVNALIDDMPRDGRVDVVNYLSLPIPLTVFCGLANIPDDELPLITHFTTALNESFTFEIANLPRERELEVVETVVSFQNYILDKIAARRADPGDDLISMMTETVVKGLGDRTMTDTEMLSTVALLLNAGTETTMNLIGSMLNLLLQHPDQWRAVVEDRSLLQNTVDEALRLESPVQALFRHTKNEAAINGVTLPAGAKIAILYGAANRDPERWDDPDTFDIYRKDASKGLYFGSGEHFCLGAHLARLEGRVTLDVIADRLKGLRLAAGNDFQRRMNPLTRGFTALIVEWDSAG